MILPDVTVREQLVTTILAGINDCSINCEYLVEEKSLRIFKSLALQLDGLKYVLHFCSGMIEEYVEDTLILGG